MVFASLPLPKCLISLFYPCLNPSTHNFFLKIYYLYNVPLTRSFSASAISCPLLHCKKIRGTELRSFYFYFSVIFRIFLCALAVDFTYFIFIDYDSLSIRLFFLKEFSIDSIYLNLTCWLGNFTPIVYQFHYQSCTGSDCSLCSQARSLTSPTGLAPNGLPCSKFHCSSATTELAYT